MNKDIRPDKTSPAYLKKTKSGGLFVGFLYVLLFMSILGLGIWQSFESSYTDAKIKTNEDRLAVIEEQMNIADEVNNDSLTDISSSIQFLDKEVRKLWDLSNKRNKVKIQETVTSLAELKITINSLKDISLQLEKLSTLNQSNISEQDKKLQSIESSNKSLLELRKDIKSLNTDILLMEESLQALNNYRKQNNAVIVQLQNEIRMLNAAVDKLDNSATKEVINLKAEKDSFE